MKKVEDAIWAWREWRTPQQGMRVLAEIGRARRAGVDEEQLPRLREVEIAVRRDFENVLGAFAANVEALELPRLANAFAKSGGAAGVSYYSDVRDDAELALRLAKEYAEDEEPQNWRLIGQIEDRLEEADDVVLLEREMVEKLRALGAGEEARHYDPDFFWWLPGERGDCYLPAHRRDGYLAMHADGEMGEPLKAGYARHLAMCADCRAHARLLAVTERRGADDE